MKLAVLAIALLTTATFGQVATVHTTGLNTPNKIIKGPANSLLVSEAGTATANSGRISVIDRSSGERHTLISGLPSAVSNLGGAPDADGPSGLSLRGNRLLVAIGVGDAVLPGGGPGLETPNATPSSPIFNSILELRLPGGFASLESGFVLTVADQTSLDSGAEVTLENAEGVQLTVRLVADLPDWRPAPTQQVPTNVKASHIYGIETFQRHAYLADAGHNDVKLVNLDTGAWSVFVSFPARPNPTPIGGPFVEAVPSNIHRFGNQLLVPLLTGFPFVPGLAEVRRISIKGANDEPFIDELTSAMDIVKADEEKEEVAEGKAEDVSAELFEKLPIAKGTASTKLFDASSIKLERAKAGNALVPGDGSAFYTLEFSTNLLGGAPGRLRFYETPGADPINLLSNLITPTSMTRDGETGVIYITNIGPGTVTRVSF